jgi:hypothetical protein
MAILQSKTKADDGIPAMLDRRNGAGKPSVEELLAKIAALEAQVASKNTLRLKVSDKGAILVYGLGRFPVPLYKSQMEAFLAAKDEMLAFIRGQRRQAQREVIENQNKCTRLKTLYRKELRCSNIMNEMESTASPPRATRLTRCRGSRPSSQAHGDSIVRDG